MLQIVFIDFSQNLSAVNKCKAIFLEQKEYNIFVVVCKNLSIGFGPGLESI